MILHESLPHLCWYCRGFVLYQFCACVSHYCEFICDNVFNYLSGQMSACSCSWSFLLPFSMMLSEMCRKGLWSRQHIENEYSLVSDSSMLTNCGCLYWLLFRQREKIWELSYTGSYGNKNEKLRVSSLRCPFNKQIFP